jgi:hypothetical protein
MGENLFYKVLGATGFLADEASLKIHIANGSGKKQ